jgi:hypothetical protein
MEGTLSVEVWPHLLARIQEACSRGASYEHYDYERGKRAPFGWVEEKRGPLSKAANAAVMMSKVLVSCSTG